MRKQHKSHKKLLLAVLFLFSVVMIFFLLNIFNRTTAPGPSQQNEIVSVSQDQLVKSRKLKHFTGAQFSRLYESFAYPNTQRISSDYPITGNTGADKKIRFLGESKGYKIRSAPVTNTFVEVAKGMKLQERAAQPWRDLLVSAKTDKESLSLTAAYRSAEDQRTILLSRLEAISLVSIASGLSDSIINKILESTAVPGYSRHHTGYTVDIACDSDPGVIFEKSSCYQWLSANNYQHAKEHGWIPSYPDGAGKQGPNPEAWEYVWVGTEALTE